MPSLFSAGPRADASPRRHSESTYAFLERCSKLGCDAIRRELQSWFDRYPNPNRAALLRRLKADDFDSAFFELYLHELLRRLGLRPQVEPDHAGKRPDFVCGTGVQQFALEASVVRGESHEERGRKAVLAIVYDAINEVNSPDYFFEVEECELKGEEQPSLRAITSFLTQRLGTLEYDSIVLLAQQNIDALPRWVLDDDRIRLVVRPIPKHSARGEAGVRTIGVYPVEGGWVTTKDSLRRRLSEKAKKLRSLGMPLVLAINALTEWGTDDDEVVDALFGSEQVVVDVATRSARPARARDGFFMGPKGAINTRVSAVLVTSVRPWTAARVAIELFLNPWSRTPLRERVLPFKLCRVTDGRLMLESGLSPADLLGLPVGWPDECD